MDNTKGDWSVLVKETLIVDEDGIEIRSYIQNVSPLVPENLGYFAY